jgi:hypothetical protein
MMRMCVRELGGAIAGTVLGALTVSCAGGSLSAAQPPAQAPSAPFDPFGARASTGDDEAGMRALTAAIPKWRATPTGTPVLALHHENRVMPGLGIGAFSGNDAAVQRGGVHTVIAARYALDGDVVYAGSTSRVPAARRKSPELWFESLPEDDTLFEDDMPIWSGAVAPGDHVVDVALVYTEGWCCLSCFIRAFVTERVVRRVHVEPATATLLRFVGVDRKQEPAAPSDERFGVDVVESSWTRREVLVPRP